MLMFTLYCVMRVPRKMHLFARRGVRGFAAATVRIAAFACFALFVAPAALRFAASSDVFVDPASVDVATSVIVTIAYLVVVDLLLAAGACFLIEVLGVAVSVLRTRISWLDEDFPAPSGVPAEIASVKPAHA